VYDRLVTYICNTASRERISTGDCFRVVFAAFLSMGMSHKQSLRRASAAVALSATIGGTQVSMTTAVEIDKMLSGNSRF